MSESPLPHRLAAEFLGSAALLVAVVGSGAMGESLANGFIGLALLANSLATAAALFILIASLAPYSGAHFNPAVTLTLVIMGRLPWRTLGPYMAAQCGGAITGALLANLLFDLGSLSVKDRWGAQLWLSEFIATAGLLLVIRGIERHGLLALAAGVAFYIGAAYWFTPSTAFANPAAALGRIFTDSFAGIAPLSALAFIAVHFLAAALVGTFFRRA